MVYANTLTKFRPKLIHVYMRAAQRQSLVWLWLLRPQVATQSVPCGAPRQPQRLAWDFGSGPQAPLRRKYRLQAGPRAPLRHPPAVGWGPSFTAATACSHDASQRHAQLSIPRLCSAWGPHTGPPHLLTVSECRVAARLGPPSCFCLLWLGPLQVYLSCHPLRSPADPCGASSLEAPARIRYPVRYLRLGLRLLGSCPASSGPGAHFGKTLITDVLYWIAQVRFMVRSCCTTPEPCAAGAGASPTETVFSDSPSGHRQATQGLWGECRWATVGVRENSLAAPPRLTAPSSATTHGFGGGLSPCAIDGRVADPSAGHIALACPRGNAEPGPPRGLESAGSQTRPPQGGQPPTTRPRAVFG